MTRTLRVSGQDTLNALKRKGFRLSHIRGSHHYLIRPGGSSLVCVPVHGNRILPTKTLRSILRQAELTEDELRELF